MNAVLLCVAAVLVGVECRGCPGQCLCYPWGGLWRTDCVRKNLFNTFLRFSHETQVLDLSHNVIFILHGNEFQDANLRRLQDLRLTDNRLDKIDKLAFNGLELLESLDLSFNSLEHLPPTLFRYNPNLRVLNVSHNRLALHENEAFLSTAPALQVLDMAHCLLRFVGPRSFFDLGQLRVLNVSHNPVVGIDPKALEGLENLQYVDASQNDLPCNDRTTAFLGGLVRRGTRVRSVCQTSQKMVAAPETPPGGEITRDEVEPLRRPGRGENGTRAAAQEEESFLHVLDRFLQSIPPFYAVLCGVHVGMLFGAVSTYLCTRKGARARADESQEGSRDRDNASFALIPLCSPPGTPPSPYRSRLELPSGFSRSFR